MGDGTWDGKDIIADSVKKYAKGLPKSVKVYLVCDVCGHAICQLDGIAGQSMLGKKFELEAMESLMVAHVIRHHGMNADGSKDKSE